MAFTTRSGVRVAIPSLVSAWTIVWLGVALLLSAPILTLPIAFITTLLGARALLPYVGEVLGSGSYLAAAICLLAPVWVAIVAASVVLPESTFRAVGRRGLSARTTWYLTGWWMSLALFGLTIRWHDQIVYLRVAVIPAVALLLAVLSTISSLRIVRSARTRPLLDGFTPAEQSSLETPPTDWPARDYPTPSTLESPVTARLYARRARDSATARYWVGTLTLLVFSGLIVPALFWSINDLKAGFWAALPVVLAALIGQAVQRRSRFYESLERAFEARAVEIEAIASEAVSARRVRWPWSPRLPSERRDFSSERLTERGLEGPATR